MTDGSDAERRLKSVAFHEAGHVVVAAVLGLKLKREGIKIDPCGKGHCDYLRRPLGADVERTEIMGRPTIISLSAGLIAQREFWPKCPDAYAACDNAEIEDHLGEMYDNPDSEEARSKVQSWREESKELVGQHWNAIQEMSGAVWDQNWTKRTDSEAWSDSVLEKSLGWERVQDILAKNSINATFWAPFDD